VKLSGQIEAKTEKGNRYGFKIGGKWASMFINPDTTEDLRQAIQNLQEGQEVELDVYESSGKDGRKYLNINSVLPQGSEDVPPSAPPTTEYKSIASSPTDIPEGSLDGHIAGGRNSANIAVAALISAGYVKDAKDVVASWPELADMSLAWSVKSRKNKGVINEPTEDDTPF